MQGTQFVPSYPGAPSDFVCLREDWEKPFDSGCDLCREISLKSTNNSLITKFSILGYYSGEVRIAVNCNKDSKLDFKNYLFFHKLIWDGSGPFIAETPADVRVLFHIISTNNEIQNEQFKKISAIVERGTCHPIQKPGHNLLQNNIFL